MFGPLMAGPGLSLEDVPREAKILAEALCAIHGAGHILREAKGLHLYMPSFLRLETDGPIELSKKHMTVNLDKACGLGMWKNRRGLYDADRTAMCMKSDQGFRVSTLLAMKPIHERGFPDAPTDAMVIVKERYLVDDGRGNMIPDHPGQVTPVTRLPPDHVAVQYLRDRGFDLERLERQFGCAWCYAETPERWFAKGDHRNLKYRPLPGGFKDTPQNRLIFYAYVKGVQVAWQARYLDKVERGVHFFYHPYDDCWTPVRVKVGGEWKLLPLFNNPPPNDWDHPAWDPSKYKTSKGALRNEMIMGFDAAVEWNVERGRKKKIAIGGEGPLDGGRFGPPGLALCGKFLSDAQADLILEHFQEFVWIGDNDDAGRKATMRVRTTLGPKLKLHVVGLPEGAKDTGGLSDEVAHALVFPFVGKL